jgi:hypothetical protein
MDAWRTFELISDATAWRDLIIKVGMPAIAPLLSAPEEVSCASRAYVPTSHSSLQKLDALFGSKVEMDRELAVILFRVAANLHASAPPVCVG